MQRSCTAPATVWVEDVPDAAIAESTDAVVRVIDACICGYDLRPYRSHTLLPDVHAGRMQPGRVLDRVVGLRIAEGYRMMNEREAIKVMVRP